MTVKHLEQPRGCARTTPGIALAALILSAVPIPAQGPPSGARPETGRAVRHDVSRPLREIGRWRRAYPAGFEVEIAMGEVARERPEAPEGPDPLRQTVARPFPEAAATPAPILDFDGIANIDSVLPPDTQGDVGVDHYVQWVNLSFAVFDKATGAIAPGGGPFSGESLWTDFEGPCEDNNHGDPIVLYDHLAGRWLMSQFAVPIASPSLTDGHQCIALSQTGDPLGTYDRWAFVVSPGQSNDYPKLGVMPDAYYLSVRDFPALSGTFAGFIAFDRAAMLAGDPGASFIKFGLPCEEGNCPDYVQPPHLEGPAPAAGTPGYFTKVWDDDFEGPWSGAESADGYRIWELVPDFAEPDDSTFTELPFVPASAGFSTDMCEGKRDCIEQPPTSAGQCFSFNNNCNLDAIADGQMYRAQYRSFAGRHDSLVLTNTVDAIGGDADIAGSRWVELRNPDPAGGGAWSLHQDGTYAPDDGVHRWMGSAAMDQAGNIALGYSVTRRTPEVFPGVRYTSREAGDPLGTMPGGEVELVAGGGTQNSISNRWGDYSSMSVDPTDDCTFWYTQEYIGAGSSAWRTRIGAFKLDSCGASIAASPDPLDLGAVQVGLSSAPMTVTLTNDGPLDYDVTGLALSNTTDFLLDPSPAADPCGAPPFPLGAGEECGVEVTFTPQSQALFDETLTATTDAASGLEAVVELEGAGYFPCSDPLDHQTLTGTAGGTIDVSTCKTVTLDAYEFTGGALRVVTGEEITILDGSSLRDSVSLAIDIFKALP